MKIIFINPIDMEKTGKTVEEVETQLAVKVIISSGIEKGKMFVVEEAFIYEGFGSIKENRDYRRKNRK